MLQLPILNVIAKTQLLSLVQKVCMLQLSFLTIFRSCCHSSSPCQSIKLDKNLTCTLHAACGYHVKRQRQEYTERRMTERITENITSVGLAHARPN